MPFPIQPVIDFIDLFYPRTCAACQRVLHQNETDFCIHCLVSLPKTNFHKSSHNPVKKLFWGRIDIYQAASYYYFTKHGRIQNLLHNIKYNGFRELADHVGRMFGSELKNDGYFSDVDLVIPVPLHPRKLKKRGYNQSEYFGKGLADSMNKKLSVNNLVRTVHSSTQTHKSKFQRWLNVNDIFTVNDPAEFYGKHILLVDDVVTTGSTIEASYLSMKNLEIRLSIATIAYASM